MTQANDKVEKHDIRMEKTEEPMTGWDTTNKSEDSENLVKKNETSADQEFGKVDKDFNKEGERDGDQDDEEEEDDEMFDLEEDIYSLMFISPNSSKEFYLSLAIVGTQLLVLIMIYIDITGDDDRPAGVEDENRFNIPVTVELQVSMAQVLAFVIVVITQENALVSIDALFLAIYDSAVMERFGHATVLRWKFVNILRWIVGLFTFGISFLIVGQSDNVLDIFMNFAALDFLDGLDNSTFNLAIGGYFGTTMEEHAKAVGTISFKRNRTPWRVTLAQLAFGANFFFLVFGWTLVRVQQRTGKFLEAEACNSVIVTLGDEVYDFEPPFPDLFKPMHYAYFSGQYFASFDSDARPIYYERGDEGNPQRGKFYYCDDEKSWHFTIPALIDVVPNGTKAYCKEGWLMQSPITDAYMLEDVTLEGWTVISGAGTPQVLQDLTIECGECSREADCSFNGVCTDEGTCECDAGWQGFRCNLVAPYCNELLWVEYGESAVDYVEVGPYKLVKVDKKDESDTGALEVYNRPVYVKEKFNDNGCGLVLLYTGRRWYETFACFTFLKDDFHAYWNALAPSFFFSDPTLSEQPVGFSWNKVRDNLSKGTYGAFGATRSVDARYVCMDIRNCVPKETCGNQGSCIVTTSGRTNCACRDFAGGFYCEFNKNSEYCREDYQAFDEFIRENGYPNETTFEELDAIIREADSLATNYYLRYWRPVLATALNVTGIESFDPNVTLEGDGSKSGNFSEGIIDSFNETDLDFNSSDVDLGDDSDFNETETEVPVPDLEEEPIVNQTDTNETTDDFFTDEFFDDNPSNETVSNETEKNSTDDFFNDEHFGDNSTTGLNATNGGEFIDDYFLDDLNRTSNESQVANDGAAVEEEESPGNNILTAEQLEEVIEAMNELAIQEALRPTD